MAVPFAGVALPSTFAGGGDAQFVEPSRNATLPPGVPAEDVTVADSATLEPAVVVAMVGTTVTCAEAMTGVARRRRPTLAENIFFNMR